MSQDNIRLPNLALTTRCSQTQFRENFVTTLAGKVLAPMNMESLDDHNILDAGVMIISGVPGEPQVNVAIIDSPIFPPTREGRGATIATLEYALTWASGVVVKVQNFQRLPPSVGETDLL